MMPNAAYVSGIWLCHSFNSRVPAGSFGGRTQRFGRDDTRKNLVTEAGGTLVTGSPTGPNTPVGGGTEGGLPRETSAVVNGLGSRPVTL
jgi:hypothetical protein